MIILGKEFKLLFEICFIYDCLHYMNVWESEGQIYQDVDIDWDESLNVVKTLVFSVTTNDLLYYLTKVTTFQDFLKKSKVFYIVNRRANPIYRGEVYCYQNLQDIISIEHYPNLDGHFDKEFYFDADMLLPDSIEELKNLCPDYETIMLFE